MTEANLPEKKLSFFRRLAIAFAVFRRARSDPRFANRVVKLLQLEAKTPADKVQKTKDKPKRLDEASPVSALQLLGLCIC